MPEVLMIASEIEAYLNRGNLMEVAEVNSKNVGRIAERIVANELEYRGFRVTDLNKEGTSANADLLAARGERTLQIQVKGASQGRTKEDWGHWWVQYGFCTEENISKVVAGPVSESGAMLGLNPNARSVGWLVARKAILPVLQKYCMAKVTPLIPA